MVIAVRLIAAACRRDRAVIAAPICETVPVLIEKFCSTNRGFDISDLRVGRRTAKIARARSDYASMLCLRFSLVELPRGFDGVMQIAGIFAVYRWVLQRIWRTRF